MFEDLFEGDVQHIDRLPILVTEVEVEQIGVEKPAKKELQREIVDPLRVGPVVLLLRIDPVLDHVRPHGKHDRIELVPWCGRVHVLGKIERKVVEYRLPVGLALFLIAVYLNGRGNCCHSPV